MSLSRNDQSTIRDYLLGRFSEDRHSEMERRVFIEDEFLEQLEIAEDELIDEYLAGTLNHDDREQFERHFLSTAERKCKLKFAAALQKYISARTAHDTAAHLGWSFFRPWLRQSWFGSPWAVAAAAAVILLGLGTVIWRGFFYQSEVSKGLIALNAAYREQRAIEGRISALSYAPFSQTRGKEQERIDATTRDRAARILLDAEHDSPGPASYHALGCFYLTEKQFDKAIDEFEQALKSDPQNAQLLNDLGVAFLEKGKIDLEMSSSGKGLEELARSNEYLNKALELDSTFLAALFNRALLYQTMKLPRQAADDWRRYLGQDPNSSWAEEARRHLKLLDEQHAISEAPSETLQKFIAAYREHDDERAWQVLSRSREMITGRMVIFQLTRSGLQAHLLGRRDEEAELFSALFYAGSLEKARGDDPFVTELASYYVSIDPGNWGQLADAYDRLDDGYRFCQSAQYNNAFTSFERARALFAKAGDTLEARLSEFWIAYCYSQFDRLNESKALLTSLAEFCRRRSYRWLLSQALGWIANCHDLLSDHSRSIALDREALDIAEAIADTHNEQELLVQLALQYTQLGRPEHALEFLWRALVLSAIASQSPRQNWRNMTTTAESFYTLKRYDAAAAYEQEALRLSLKELRDPALTHLSYTHLAIILAGLGHYSDAVKQAEASLQVARDVQPDPISRRMMAYSLLQVADLTRQSGDYRAALVSYDEALALYEGMEFDLDRYEAHKGRLLCYLKSGDDTAIQNELQQVQQLFEAHRSVIAEEQNRNSFFNSEQDIYDIAIDYAYARGDNLQAFAYSELSRARSLLDLLQHGPAETSTDTSELMLAAASVPFDAAAIRARLPSGLQVVQYAVLKDRLLIWVISNSQFEVIEQGIQAAQLDAGVKEYVDLLTRNDETHAGKVKQRAEALFDLLIKRIEPLLDSRNEVCVIPDKALFYLPFASLVSPTTGDYLVQDFTLLFAPSLTVLVLCSDAARQRGQSHTEKLLSIGNPAFDHAVYPQLPDLPSAELEAKQAAQLYASAVALTGSHALKAAITALLGRADVIHFACHYIVDENSPMRSRLLLAKGSAEEDTLTAAEVYRKRLTQTRLVVLSACQTELELFYKGEGMVGMARTFLAAGAPLVVASQWSIDSDATRELMVSFHRLRNRGGLTTSAALRAAQLEMIESTNGRYRRPYYWAAFLPIGGHADY